MKDWNRDGNIDGKDYFDNLGGSFYSYKEMEKEESQLQEDKELLDGGLEVRGNEQNIGIIKKDLSEADMEYLLAKYPEQFIEKDLLLFGRQVTFGKSRIDLLFKDKRGSNLIVEIQKGVLDRKHLYRMLDYYDDFKRNHREADVELLIIANEITSERKEKLIKRDIQYLEIPIERFIEFAEKMGEIGNLSSIDSNTDEGVINTKADAILESLREKLRNPKVPESNIHKAIFFNDYEWLESLVETGADLTECDDGGWIPLDAVLCHGQLEMANLIIDHLPDVNIRNQHGQTPIFQAISKGHYDIVAKLIEKGADVNIFLKNYRVGHRTPLENAITDEQYDIADLLVKHGADVNICDDEGKSLLHNAVDNLELFKRLLKWGANPNKKENKYGNSPLHDVVCWGSIEMVALLLENGADVNARDSLMQTPLHVAVFNHEYDKAKLLVCSGADMNAVANTAFGGTPIDYAKKLNDIGIMAVFGLQNIKNMWPFGKKRD